MPGVATRIKKYNFEKKRFEFFLGLYVTPQVPMGSLKNVDPFRLAVWPAIANIQTYIHTYMSEELYYRL